MADFYKGYSKDLVAFDKKGVIYYKKNNRYHPALISRWGLSSLKAYCKFKDKKALISAYDNAKYLIEKTQKYNDFFTWHYDFPGGLNDAGYSSSIANGAIVDLLLHLGFLIGSDDLIEHAKMGALSFTKSIDDGGLLFKMENDLHYFYEEYAIPDAKIKHILNGHILGMMHIDTYIKNYEIIYKNDKNDKNLSNLKFGFNEAVKAVYNFMNYFDVEHDLYGKTTYYDLGKIRIKGPDLYPHRIHTCGLYWLSLKTKNEEFFNLAEKWRNYRTNKSAGCQKLIKRSSRAFKNS